MLDLSYISQRLIRKARFIGGADVAQTVFRGTTLADTEVRRRAVGIARNYPNDIIDYYHRNNMNMISADNLEKMGLVEPNNSRYIQEGFLRKDELDNAVRCDLLEYLPGDGLLKTDRTTMAVSLESRTPFCDVDLASFCIALPFHLKVSDKTDKIILRKSMENMWTKEISHNIKTGFSPPWDKWLASEQVKELMEEYFFNTNAKIWDFLDYKGTTSFLVRTKGWPRWILLNLALCGTRQSQAFYWRRRSLDSII